MSKTKQNKKESVLESQLARALADYDNLQKRVEKEKSEYKKIATAKVIIKMLPAIDMLEEVQRNLKDKGLEMAMDELFESLKEEGVKKVDSSKGVKFDENVHEAVEVVSGGDKKPTVEEEVSSGWMIDDTLIRPAKVKVKN